ncbi:MAG TPA: peptide ABC transporter substrate-binding protein [Candidatus Limnocylindrales bacterium]
MNIRERGILAAALVVLAFVAGLLIVSGPTTTPAASASPSGFAATPVLRVGTVGRVETLDPLYATDPAERDAIELLFRGLTRLGPAGTVQPDLASDWEVSDDGRTWTFELRDDVRWHDGQPVTADDVVFTVLSLQHPDYDGPHGNAFRNLTVERLSPTRVRFVLERPLASFLTATTQPIVPAHLLAAIPVAERRATAFSQQPVGSGPFRLAALGEDEVLLERAGPPPGGAAASLPADPFATPIQATPAPPQDGPQRPHLDALALEIYPDAASLADAVEAGEVDMAGDLPADRIEALSTRPGLRPIAYPTSHLTAAVLNLRAGGSPFRDAGVRRALLQAIDREGLVAEVVAGHGVITDVPIAPSSALYDRGGPGVISHDQAAAAKALRAAGWKKVGGSWQASGAKEPLRIEVATIDAESNPQLHAAAERVVAAWKDLGIKATLKAYPPAEFVEGQLRSGDFDAAVVEMDLGLDPDLTALLDSSQAARGGSNLAGFQSAKMDGLLAAARMAVDPAQRATKSAELQRELAERMPFLPLFLEDRVEILGDRLDGPTPRLISRPSDRFWDVLTWRLAETPEQ